MARRKKTSASADLDAPAQVQSVTTSPTGGEVVKDQQPENFSEQQPTTVDNQQVSTDDGNGMAYNGQSPLNAMGDTQPTSAGPATTTPKGGGATTGGEGGATPTGAPENSPLLTADTPAQVPLAHNSSATFLAPATSEGGAGVSGVSGPPKGGRVVADKKIVPEVGGSVSGVTEEKSRQYKEQNTAVAGQVLDDKVSKSRYGMKAKDVDVVKRGELYGRYKDALSDKSDVELAKLKEKALGYLNDKALPKEAHDEVLAYWVALNDASITPGASIDDRFVELYGVEPERGNVQLSEVGKSGVTESEVTKPSAGVPKVGTYVGSIDKPNVKSDDSTLKGVPIDVTSSKAPISDVQIEKPNVGVPKVRTPRELFIDMFSDRFDPKKLGELYDKHPNEYNAAYGLYDKAKRESERVQSQIDALSKGGIKLPVQPEQKEYVSEATKSVYRTLADIKDRYGMSDSQAKADRARSIVAAVGDILSNAANIWGAYKGATPAKLSSLSKAENESRKAREAKGLKLLKEANAELARSLKADKQISNEAFRNAISKWKTECSTIMKEYEINNRQLLVNLRNSKTQESSAMKAITNLIQEGVKTQNRREEEYIRQKGRVALQSQRDKSAGERLATSEAGKDRRAENANKNTNRVRKR